MPYLLSLLVFSSTQAPLAPLQLPVRCQPGRNCFVQKLVDQQIGPGRRDYRCGTLTTEEHDGVDIRLPTLADMRQGVTVVAAAAGTVLRVRDGEPDISVRERPVAPERMAGNGVVIAHGNGWETQYSHLGRGSIAVHLGQRVTAGQKLGVIGLSGNTEYPHLHFAVRHNGQTIDPFTASPRGASCHAHEAFPAKGLWSRSAAAALRYEPTAVLAVGFSAGPADAAVARKGDYDHAAIRVTDPMVLWADSFGTKDGDMQIFTVTGPGNVLLFRHELRIERGALSWFGFSGKRPPPAGWQPGRYQGSYALLRDGKLISKGTTTVEVR